MWTFLCCSFNLTVLFWKCVINLHVFSLANLFWGMYILLMYVTLNSW
jgi:hypothetical protein